MGLYGGSVIGTILGDVYGITIGIDVGTYLGSLDGSLDRSYYVNIQGLLLVGSLGYTDGKVLGSYEGIKLGLSAGKVLVTILVNVDGITWDLLMVTPLHYT